MLGIVRVAVSFLLLLAYLASSARAADLVWVQPAGSTVSDRAHHIALDSSGNVYAVGSFEGTADFDPALTTSLMTSAGDMDAFIWKMDRNGQLIWARQLGGPNDDTALSVAVDGSAVYVVGWFEGPSTINFGPTGGPLSLSTTSINATFVLKLSHNGNVVWGRVLGGVGPDETLARDVAVDTLGNVYTVGVLFGTADFDPSGGQFNLSSSAAAGAADGFISILDVNGNYSFAGDFGNNSLPCASHGVAVVGSDVYVVGRFQGTADLDPTVTTFPVTALGGWDAFVAKLTTAGNLSWARQLEGGTGVHAEKVFATSTDVYTVGTFTGTADFDPTLRVSNLIASGLEDVFVSKLSASGGFGWAKKLGGPQNDYGRDLTLDGAGNVYVVGDFKLTADFDPGTGTFYLTASGGNSCFCDDAFLTILDNSGDFVDAVHAGGPISHGGPLTADDARGVAVDPPFIYVAGRFKTVADFDPSSFIHNLTAVGGSGHDAYVWKLSVPPIISQGAAYCITGTSTGADYSWAIDRNGNGSILDLYEPLEANVLNTVAIGGAGSALASAFVLSINANALSKIAGCLASVTTPTNCFSLFCPDNCHGGSFCYGPCVLPGHSPCAPCGLCMVSAPELYVGPPNNPNCHVTATGCTYNPTIVKQEQCSANEDCDDADACSIDKCDFGICLNLATPDTDGDTLCDADDNCLFESNLGQQDTDGDGVGDVCDNCEEVANPEHGVAVFGQEIVAQDKSTFAWADPLDTVFVRGELALVSTYPVDRIESLQFASTFADATSPAVGSGFFYLAKPDCEAGSWQTSVDTEEVRDAALP